MILCNISRNETLVSEVKPNKIIRMRFVGLGARFSFIGYIQSWKNLRKCNALAYFAKKSSFQEPHNRRLNYLINSCRNFLPEPFLESVELFTITNCFFKYIKRVKIKWIWETTIVLSETYRGYDNVINTYTILIKLFQRRKRKKETRKHSRRRAGNVNILSTRKTLYKCHLSNED